jgi:molybdopterin-synthase adenylyltransferase
MSRLYHRPALTADAWPRLDSAGPMAPEALPAIAPALRDALTTLLDGTRSAEEVYGACVVRGHAPEDITAALALLEHRGLVTEAACSDAAVMSDDELARYRDHMGLFAPPTWHGPHAPAYPSSWQRAGGPAQVALKQAIVVVLGAGRVGGALLDALALAGVGRLLAVGTAGDADAADGPLGGHAERIARQNPFVAFQAVGRVEDLPSGLEDGARVLLVYAPDRFDDGEAELVNSVALAQAVPVVFYRRTVWTVELGPLVIPRETACWVCQQRRRAGARPPWDTGAADGLYAASRPPFPLAVDLLALEVLKHYTRLAPPVVRSHLWRIDVLRGTVELHPVLKLPRCPACGVHKHRPSRRLWEH